MIRVHARGISIPALGFGTWKLSGGACRHSVADALSIGYRHIDTAQRYGNEEEVGQAILSSSVPREEIFLSTKLVLECTAGMVAQTAEESLRKLGTDYVDLLFMHWPNAVVPQRETLEAMQVLVESGRVRAIGVSNFTPDLLGQALNIVPVVANQVEYHPYLSQRALLAFAEQNDIMIGAHSPLARGEVVDDPVIKEIAAKYHKTNTQVTLRWLVQQPRVFTIPRSGNPLRRKANFEIFDFELTSEDMDGIHALDRGHRIVDPPYAPSWDR